MSSIKNCSSRNTKDIFNLNACLVHEFRHFRKDQITRTNSKWVDCIILINIRLQCMAGAQRLTENIIESIAIGGGIMMIIRYATSWNVQQQRWSWTVDCWYSGSPVVGFMILRLVDNNMASFMKELGDIQRGICRVFVNVCEVR